MNVKSKIRKIIKIHNKNEQTVHWQFLINKQAKQRTSGKDPENHAVNNAQHECFLIEVPK